MSTPRTPPIPPNKGGELDKSSPSDHRKVERVEKVAEVDDESRARQKFRQFVDAKEEKPSPHPTPFTLFSSPKDNPPSIQSEKTATATPSPAYSPAPSTYLSGTAAQDNVAPSPLPQSQQFYGNVDENPPPNQSASQPQMNETSRSSSRVFVSKEDQSNQSSDQNTDNSSEGSTTESSKTKGKGSFLGQGESIKGTQPSPFGPSDKTGIEIKGGLLSGIKEGGLSPSSGKKAGSEFGDLESLAEIIGEGETPLSITAKIGEDKEKSFSPQEDRKKRSEGLQGIIAPQGKEGSQYVGPLAEKKSSRADYTGPILSEQEIESHAAPIFKEENPIGKQAQMLDDNEKEGERDKKKSEKDKLQSLQIASPTLTLLPDFVIPMATAAATAAVPHLGPEALAIYFHMIGTITAMVSPKGDSRTDFILNAPSFANSRFYGATISIERFATAPYQLNIRLTGSNEAVTLFNQNLPNLLAAFQSNKNLAFTINRIEAAYEKPLFRRKESVGEKDEKGKGFSGGGDTDNRKGR